MFWHRFRVFRMAAPFLGALLLAGAPAPAFAQLPALGSAGDEARIGAEEHPKIVAEFGGTYDDPRIRSYVDALGARLAAVSDRKDVAYTFTVLDSPVVNAFALPGGYVYITRGLLAYATDEAELAGVLGHEIGHVVARHQAQRQTGQLLGTLGSMLLGAVLDNPNAARIGQGVAGAALASYSRDQEYEADDYGVVYLSRVGMDPYAQGDFLLTLLGQSQLADRIAGREGRSKGVDFMASHPNTGERVRRAMELARQTGAKPGALPRDRDALLSVVDGMVFGDDPSEGLVRDRTFLHPGLRIAFDVPQGFQVDNGTRAVTAGDGKGGMLIFDGGQAPAGMPMTDYLAGQWARGARLSDLQPVSVNGMEAATAIAEASAGNRPALVRLVAIRAAGGRVYRFMMGAPAERMRAYDPLFQRVAQSFRGLSAAEAGAIRPRRLRVVTVGKGDTVQSISARMAFPDHKEEQFRLLNALAPDEALRPGVRVKLVTQD